MEGDIYGYTCFGTSKNILTHLFSLLPMLNNTTSYKSSYCHQKYVSMITELDVTSNTNDIDKFLLSFHSMNLALK